MQGQKFFSSSLKTEYHSLGTLLFVGPEIRDDVHWDGSGYVL